MIEQLEAALADEFSLENLQVYGDALQAIGDPRGHLIAIDLHIAQHGSNRDLEYRRRQRLRDWLELPKSVDPTNGPWKGVRFAFGFVEDLRVELALQVLKSPAGAFVRGLSLSSRIPHMVGVLHELGNAPRPWLDRLTLVSRVRSAPPSEVWSSHAALLEQSWVAPVIAATPRLQLFELSGNRMIRAFPHPSVSRIRIDGVDALLSILEPGPAMSAVCELELTFAHAPAAPVLMESPWPGLVPAESFPALTRLDLSENWTRATTDTQIDVFDVLPELGVREQLEELRLWGILDQPEWTRFRRIEMPSLRRLEVEHQPRHWELELPGVTIVKVPPRWPRDAGAIGSVWMAAPGFPGRQMRLSGLIRTCRYARSWLAPEAYEAWQVVWQNIEALPYGGPGYGVSLAILRRALDGLGYLDASHQDLWSWAMLHGELAGLREDLEVWMSMHDPSPEITQQ